MKHSSSARPSLRGCATFFGPNVLREFVQNADDAKAKHFSIVLDYGCEPGNGSGVTTGTGSNNSCSPSTGGGSDGGEEFAPLLEATRGPALVIYNDSVFTDKDFNSIASVGASGKAADASTIGKYGLGFNVSYHLADLVTFVSRDRCACVCARACACF